MQNQFLSLVSRGIDGLSAAMKREGFRSADNAGPALFELGIKQPTSAAGFYKTEQGICDSDFESVCVLPLSKVKTQRRSAMFSIQ